MARRTNVVNFERFRRRRARRHLPLFDEGVPGAPAPAARELKPREVTHRERMLAHLKASSGAS